MVDQGEVGVEAEGGGGFAREFDVLADGEVGEEGGVLGGPADVSKMRGNVGLAVLEDGDGVVGVVAFEVDGGVGEEAADGSEDGAFAAAGRAEEECPRGGEVEVDAEVECAETGAEGEAVVGSCKL